MTNNLPETLKEYLVKNDLPGEEAQLIMTPYRRLTKVIPEDRREGAVLLLLYKKDGVWYFPLTQRNEYKGVHSKQMSFPGGKIELDDATFYDAALRETREEIGVFEPLINNVGELSSLYIPPSNFIVYPFVGFLKEEPVFVKDDVEVDEIVEVKVTDLLHEENKRETIVNTNGKIKLKTPYFHLNDKIVWGATAAILAEFKEILKNIK